MDTRTGIIYPLSHELYQALTGEDKKHMMPIMPTKRQLGKMKVSRNDPCPCGSGLKFKKCHLGKPV
jgi:uncharacterized protein YecA (UPF0149 family)